MNDELMLQIADAIEAKPDQFDLDFWFTQQRPHPVSGRIEWREPIDYVDAYQAMIDGACGTRGCIAGWAHVLTRTVPGTMKMETRGAELLDLTHGEADQLFMPESKFWAEMLDDNPDVWETDAPFVARILRDLVAGDVELLP